MPAHLNRYLVHYKQAFAFSAILCPLFRQSSLQTTYQTASIRYLPTVNIWSTRFLQYWEYVFESTYPLNLLAVHNYVKSCRSVGWVGWAARGLAKVRCFPFSKMTNGASGNWLIFCLSWSSRLEFACARVRSRRLRQRNLRLLRANLPVSRASSSVQICTEYNFIWQ